MARLCRKIHEEIKNVGGQFVPVYNRGVDEQKTDALIRDFCIAHYSDKYKNYVIADTYLPSKGKFLGLLYIMLQKYGIVLMGDNVSPFCARLEKLLVDQKYTVDRSGLSRVKKKLLDLEHILSLKLSPEYVLAMSDSDKETRDMYISLLNDWGDFEDSHTE